MATETSISKESADPPPPAQTPAKPLAAPNNVVMRTSDPTRPRSALQRHSAAQAPPRRHHHAPPAVPRALHAPVGLPHSPGRPDGGRDAPLLPDGDAGGRLAPRELALRGGLLPSSPISFHHLHKILI